MKHELIKKMLAYKPHLPVLFLHELEPLPTVCQSRKLHDRWQLLWPKIQTRLCLCPYAFHSPTEMSIKLYTECSYSNDSQNTLTQTGTSGNSRRYTFACFISFSFRFKTSWAVVNCFALNLMPFPRMRIP